MIPLPPKLDVARGAKALQDIVRCHERDMAFFGKGPGSEKNIPGLSVFSRQDILLNDGLLLSGEGELRKKLFVHVNHL